MHAIPDALEQSLRDKLSEDNIKLPSLPDTVIKVQQLMAGDDYSAAAIADIIGHDQAFATIILRLANSAHFNPSGNTVRNLQTAVQRIGPQSILKLLIGVASRMVCQVKQAELRGLVTRNQEHSLMVAATAERIAHVSQCANPSDTFMAGLLHDQGKDITVMAIPDDLLQASDSMRTAIIGRFHREMGARLLLKWKLPEDFVLVAQHHSIEAPDRPRMGMLDCVDVADAMVKAMQSGSDDVQNTIASHAAAKRLRLSDTQITGIVMEVEDSIEELQQSFAI